jgi:polyhydroxyalkanoic acid synthase PhaR subunit
MSQNPEGTAKPGTAYDPFAAWKSFYQMNEEAWTQMLEQMMGTQAFAKAMGQWLDNSLKAQDAARKNVEASLSAMNFPSKGDITRLAEQIVAVDAKLDDVSFAVEQLGDELRALKERGPEAVRAELEALSTQVAALAKAVGKPRATKPKASEGSAT